MRQIIVIALTLLSVIVAQINATCSLSFKNSDIYCIKKLIYFSEPDNSNCNYLLRDKIIDAFMLYGQQKGWTTSTQFGELSNYGPNDTTNTITLDPELFGCNKEAKLTIAFPKKGGFYPRFGLSLSPDMGDLVKKMLENSRANKEESQTQ